MPNAPSAPTRTPPAVQLFGRPVPVNEYPLPPMRVLEDMRRAALATGEPYTTGAMPLDLVAAALVFAEWFAGRASGSAR